MYKYAYIVLCGILGIFWLFAYWQRKDLRREMLWASLLGMPFGIVDFFLVPYYWHPDSLFGLMPKFGVGIESFLFVFLGCGICSVIYEYVFGRKLKRSRSKSNHILALVVPLAFFFILASRFPQQAIYAFIFAGVLGAIMMLAFRKDLWDELLFSGLLYALLYGLAFFFVTKIFPGLVYGVYNTERMLGVYLWGVPIEEILAGMFVGSFWSTTYEYIKGYRLK